MMKNSITYLGIVGVLTLALAAQLHASEAAAAVTPSTREASAQTEVKQLPLKESTDKETAAPTTFSKTGKAIMKLLQLPVKDRQGSCLRSVIDQHFSGKEMFAVEKCPFVKSAILHLFPDIEQSGSSKGKLRIDVSCSIKNNDYYVGKLKKSFAEDVKATIEAEYVYALEDLSLKNFTIQGDEFCAQPIKVQIKKYQ